MHIELTEQHQAAQQLEVVDTHATRQCLQRDVVECSWLNFVEVLKILIKIWDPNFGFRNGTGIVSEKKLNNSEDKNILFNSLYKVIYTY